VKRQSTGGSVSHPVKIGRADVVCSAVLLALIAVVTWNRLTVGQWVARHDLMTFFVPWYAFLGERLRDFEIPGWNPHLFSGTPFAGDPESGWMYLPAMLLTPFFAVITAFKAMVAVHLVIAGLSTYAFCRLLGMGAVAGLVASVAFVFGPLVQWTTYCCTIFSQFSTWIPLALIGVELAVLARSWRTRILPWFITGFALSQMFAGWIGEGWILALLVIGGYVLYRAVFSPPHGDPDLKSRLILGVTTGLATVGSGLSLGAAGILIRLDVNAESQLAGGDYDALEQASTLNFPWSVEQLFLRIAGSGFNMRQTTLGGAVIVLAVLAPILVRRRFAVPYFCVLTVIPMIIALHHTPLHDVFYLIPGFQTFHEHDPWRVYSVATIGPAILCGAVVNELPRLRGQRHLWPVVAYPMLVLVVVASIVDFSEDFIGWQPIIAAAVTTFALIIAVVWPRNGQVSLQRDRLVPWIAGVIVAAIILQPTAIEVSGSWFGWPADKTWQAHWHPISNVAQGVEIDTSGTDSGGAGEFLQIQLEKEGVFRYVGYGGYGYNSPPQPRGPYSQRRFEPDVHAILVNGRPVFLHLYEIQGYNPLQLARYTDFMTAINGRPQNYHYATLFDSGVDSPLLNLLNVRYFVVPAWLPKDRSDIVDLTEGKTLVFHNDLVDVYENPEAFPHAWIVHDVQELPKDEILHELRHRAIDPRQTAYVEETPPPVEAAKDPSADLVQLLRFDPDAISLSTRSDAPGLLVLSEIYDPGWRAFVDGQPVDVLAANYALRGVPVPAGDHTVELRYEPRSLQIGLIVSGFAYLALIAAVIASTWPVMRRAVARREARAQPTTPILRPDRSDGRRSTEGPTGGMAK
jgi:hypothetical protein